MRKYKNCDYCRYEHLEMDEMPCRECNYKDKAMDTQERNEFIRKGGPSWESQQK